MRRVRIRLEDSVDDGRKAAFLEVSWSQIAGIGNILRHEYHRVEAVVIWNITRTHLSVLKSAVQQMLYETDTAPKPTDD